MRVRIGAPSRAALSLRHARLAANASSGSRRLQTAAKASVGSCSKRWICSSSDTRIVSRTSSSPSVRLTSAVCPAEAYAEECNS
eukprot:3627678-Prymnesium_polylepis.1